tara:strand:- start:3043 stop:3309 length:267 start_codon:yes stop_codon:yes gene_type:complete
MSYTQVLGKNHTVSIKVTEYDECETIEEKIECCEDILNSINTCMLEGKCILNGIVGSLKNETGNALYWEKLYKTRLRMLRKRLKKQKK